MLLARDRLEVNGVGLVDVRQLFSIKREDAEITRTTHLTEIGRTLAEYLGVAQRSPETLGGRSAAV